MLYAIFPLCYVVFSLYNVLWKERENETEKKGERREEFMEGENAANGHLKSAKFIFSGWNEKKIGYLLFPYFEEQNWLK